MRFSNYNILSEQLNNGEYLLLNGLTGTLDLIDEEAYALITANSKENILPATVINQLAGVCEHFVERGYLTELSADEELLKAETLAFDLLEKQDYETDPLAHSVRGSVLMFDPLPFPAARHRPGSPRPIHAPALRSGSAAGSDILQEQANRS